jgi:hypothetical protein
MDSDRKTARTAGALFIVATAASLIGTALSQPILGGTGDLASVSAGANQVSLGVLMEFIAAGTSAGIAIALYPVLRKWSAGLSLGSVVFRGIEAAMYTAGALILLSLVPLGQRSTDAAASADRGAMQLIGDSLLTLRADAILAGVFAFCVGSLFYSYVFYRSRLIPRWLSGWGIAADLLLLVACLSALFSGSPVTSYTILILPIAAQEMILAVWLIARGFSPSAVRSEAVSMVAERGYA